MNKTTLVVCRRQVTLATTWRGTGASMALVTTLNGVAVHRTAAPVKELDVLRQEMAAVAEFRIALRCVRHCRAESLGHLAEVLDDRLNKVHGRVSC